MRMQNKCLSHVCWWKCSEIQLFQTGVATFIFLKWKLQHSLGTSILRIDSWIMKTKSSNHLHSDVHCSFISNNQNGKQLQFTAVGEWLVTLVYASCWRALSNKNTWVVSTVNKDSFASSLTIYTPLISLSFPITLIGILTRILNKNGKKKKGVCLSCL